MATLNLVCNACDEPFALSPAFVAARPERERAGLRDLINEASIPVRLPCGHTLCRGCIGLSVYAFSSIVSCDVCGTAHYVAVDEADTWGAEDFAVMREVAITYGALAVDGHTTRTGTEATAPGPAVDVVERKPTEGAAPTSATRKTAVTDCMFHDRKAGGCSNGPMCKFRHRAERATSRVCRNWMKLVPGSQPSCRDGGECSFAHPCKDVLAQIDCPLFLDPAARCDPTTCRLRHMEGARREILASTTEMRPCRVMLCKDWTKGLCPRRDKCPNIHSMSMKHPYKHGYEFLERGLEALPPVEATLTAQTEPRAATERRTRPAVMQAHVPERTVHMPTPAVAPPVVATPAAARALTLLHDSGRRTLPGRRCITLWDIENCPFRGMTASDVVHRIRDALRELRVLTADGENEIRAFYNPRLEGRYALPGGAASALAEAGIMLVDVGIKRGAADVGIKEGVAKALRDAEDGLPIGAVVIISGDGDFCSDLRAIERHRKGVRSVLFAGPAANDTLKTTADITVDWQQLFQTPRSEHGRAASSPPEGASASFTHP